MDRRSEFAIRILAAIVEKEGIRGDGYTAAVFNDDPKAEASAFASNDAARAVVYADALIARLGK